MKPSARTVDTNGWIEIKDNPISKVGVFQYSGESLGKGFESGKMYNVYRPAEELGDPETINSFRLLPWTNDHPSKLLGNSIDGRLPTEEKGIDGVIGENVYFDGEFLRANIKVFSESLAEDIKNGKKDLSPGYTFLCEVKKGVYNGEPYEIIQRKPRGNHLSSVHEGRTGPEVSVLDNGENLMKEDQESKAKAKDEVETESLGLAALKEMFERLEAKVDALVSVGASSSATDEDDKKKEEDKEGYDKKAKDAKCMDEESNKKKDDEKGAMDAAEFRKSFYTEMAEREELIKSTLDEVGVFDAADKTLSEVATYIAEKLPIQCPKGHEKTAIKAYVAGKKSASVSSTVNVMDKKSKASNQMTAHFDRLRQRGKA